MIYYDKPYKILLVSDFITGKESFLDEILADQAQKTSNSAYFKSVTIVLKDLNKSEEIQEADGFMVLFSIENRASFENVQNWVCTVRCINQSAPILLVAEKKDLRDRAQTKGELNLVSKDEIKTKCDELKLKFIETSSVKQDGSVKQALFKLISMI